MSHIWTYDIAIIGVGRVGLPLALCFKEQGLHVVAIDKNRKILASLSDRKMPFSEPKCDDLLSSHGLDLVSDNYKHASKAKHIIITVGTPVLEHLEVDLSQVIDVLRGISVHLQAGHNVVLRSTVGPSCMKRCLSFFNSSSPFTVGEQIGFSYCPERLAEGFACAEIYSLPQIVAAEDELSHELAHTLFQNLTSQIFHTSFSAGELAKVCSNSYRYLQFAFGNLVAVYSEQLGCSAHEVIHLCNENYPRCNIALPGFCAGTCLRKDFAMLSELTPQSDILLSAWKTNEGMPKFYVNTVLKTRQIRNSNVAVLGFAFKKDTDDSRDSLTPKLVRYIQKESPKSLNIQDPFLPETLDGGFYNCSLETALKDADMLFLACNHSTYSKNLQEIYATCKPECLVCDIWNICKMNKLIFTIAEAHKGSTHANVGVQIPRKRVLVTGGAGFIGYFLSKRLVDLGYDVVILDNFQRGKKDESLKNLISHDNVELLEMDLCKPLELNDGEYFDIVFHLAAVNGTDNFYKIPQNVLRTNLLSTMNLLEWASNENCGKIVFTSSAEAYAGTIATNLNSEDLIPTPEEIPLCIDNVMNPRHSYGGSKLVGELLIINYCRSKSIRWSIARVHNIYGPRDGVEHVIPKLCDRLLRSENPLKLFGGYETRAFCYVEDCADALHKIGEETRTDSEIFHVGSMEEISIKDMAIKLIAASNLRDITLEVLSAPVGCVKRRCPNTDKIRDTIEWNPCTNIDIGLKKCWNWYQKNTDS